MGGTQIGGGRRGARGSELRAPGAKRGRAGSIGAGARRGAGWVAGRSELRARSAMLGVLFVDIKAACYCVIRELVHGTTEAAPSVQDLACAMGL